MIFAHDYSTNLNQPKGIKAVLEEHGFLTCTWSARNQSVKLVPLRAVLGGFLVNNLTFGNRSHWFKK